MLCHRSNYEEIFLPNEYNQRPLKRDAKIDPLWLCTLLGKDSRSKWSKPGNMLSPETSSVTVLIPNFPGSQSTVLAKAS